MHLVGDLFELYNDAQTYKPKIVTMVKEKAMIQGV
jgi:hypothetical protein